jgi:hypothetical protein
MGYYRCWWFYFAQDVKNYKVMNEYTEKVKTWFNEHKALGIGALVIVLFFIMKKLKPRTVRRRRLTSRRSGTVTRRTRRIPRAVGMAKAGRSVNRIIKSGRYRGKKAWQIKGSPEARRHMAAIRRKRSSKLF